MQTAARYSQAAGFSKWKINTEDTEMAKTDEDLLQDLKDATIFVEEQPAPKTYKKVIIILTDPLNSGRICDYARVIKRL